MDFGEIFLLQMIFFVGWVEGLDLCRQVEHWNPQQLQPSDHDLSGRGMTWILWCGVATYRLIFSSFLLSAIRCGSPNLIWRQPLAVISVHCAALQIGFESSFFDFKFPHFGGCGVECRVAVGAEPCEALTLADGFIAPISCSWAFSVKPRTMNVTIWVPCLFLYQSPTASAWCSPKALETWLMQSCLRSLTPLC